MSLRTPHRAVRVLPLVVAGVLAIGIGGCAFEHRTTLTNVSQDELAAGGEPYFDSGPVTYQVQESRQLNPFAPDDVQYFAGVPDAQSIGPNQLWLGVFLWAKNQTARNQTTASRFEIIDSNGTVYQPTTLNPEINPYAWSAQTLAQNDTEPGADTTAAYGPTGGGLILFKLNQSIYSNRPLTLLVFAPGATKATSRVSLDL